MDGTQMQMNKKAKPSEISASQEERRTAKVNEFGGGFET